MNLGQRTQHFLTRGHVVPLIVVFAAVTSCQHDQQSFTGTRRAATLAASTAWPNEPGGFAVLTDYAFNDAIGSGGGVQLSGGWAITNPNGYVTELTNRTDAPLSPPNVGQWAYPVGYSAGDAPGTMYFSHAAVKEVYAGFWWEPSNPWQGHASGANDIAFWKTASGGIFVMRMSGSGAGPFQTEFSLESGVSTNYAENAGASSPLALGQWHRVEFYVKYATTSTSGDGIVQWWLDGVLLGSYAAIQTPNDAGFVQFEFSPIWGGVGGAKAEQDYYWYDHVHLSRR
jgi:hypothetical protein